MSRIMDSTELKKKLKEKLPEKRYRHSLSVAETAAMLAKKFGLSEKDAYLAGLYHDAYRYIKKEDALKDLKKRGVKIFKEEEEDEKLLHAPVAASHMREDLGDVRSDLIKAVRYHTLGSKEMGKLGACIYIADYAEPNRTHISDEEKKYILSLPSLEDMVIRIIEEQDKYFKEAGIKSAEVSIELYEFLKDGGKF